MYVKNIKGKVFEKLSIDLKLVDDESKDSNRNRVSVLIGKNGTFKSSILRLISEAAQNLQSKSGNIEAFISGQPNRVVALSSSLGDKFPLPRYNVFPQWLYKGATQDVNYFYFGPRSRLGNSNRNAIKQLIDAIALGTNSESSRVNVNHYFRNIGLSPKIEFILKKSKRLAKLDKKESVKQLENLVEKRLKDNPLLDNAVLKYVKKFKQYDEGVGIVLDLANDPDISLKLAAISIFTNRQQLRIEHIFVEKKHLNSTSRFDINDLSSGEANLLMKAIALGCSVQDFSLILIDEPENSLHPDWQTQYLSDLMKGLEAVRGCHIVICTHSPHIISSAAPETCTVISISREVNAIQGKIVQTSAFGWSIENILLEIFGVATTRNFYFEMKIRELLSGIGDKSKNERSRKIILDLEKFTLGDFDPLYLMLKDAKKIVGFQ